MGKATFTVGVFAAAACVDFVGNNGVVKIKVNVRTDQDKQKERLKINLASPQLVVDMPGGGVELEDFADPVQAASFFPVLQREVSQETGGCTIESLGDFRGPAIAITNREDPAKLVGDLAFWMPVKLIGTPKPSAEALDHPWVSWEELRSATKYCTVSGIGKMGRMDRMLEEAFRFFAEKRMFNQHEAFSSRPTE